VADASKVNLAGILHGEQEILFHNPIPPEGTLTTEGAITHYYDRGKDKGAFIVGEFETRHSNGQKLYTSIATVLARLDGGFGGENPTKEEVGFRTGLRISRSLTPGCGPAAFFQTLGGYLPLHVMRSSPEWRDSTNRSCTVCALTDFACRAVIQSLFSGEPERMTRFKVRFSKPLYPGVPSRPRSGKWKRKGFLPHRQCRKRATW